MSDVVVLDGTPLGILCHPRNPPHTMACRQWVDDLLGKGRRVLVPENQHARDESRQAGIS